MKGFIVFVVALAEVFLCAMCYASYDYYMMTGQGLEDLIWEAIGCFICLLALIQVLIYFFEKEEENDN